MKWIPPWKWWLFQRYYIFNLLLVATTSIESLKIIDEMIFPLTTIRNGWTIERFVVHGKSSHCFGMKIKYNHTIAVFNICLQWAWIYRVQQTCHHNWMWFCMYASRSWSAINECLLIFKRLPKSFITFFSLLSAQTFPMSHNSRFLATFHFTECSFVRSHAWEIPFELFGNAFINHSNELAS